MCGHDSVVNQSLDCLLSVESLAKQTDIELGRAASFIGTSWLSETILGEFPSYAKRGGK